MEARIGPLPAPINPATLAQHAEGLRRLARHLVAQPQDVDDLVQEACLAALQGAPLQGAPAGPWLVRVARNLAARLSRQRARRARRERKAARAEALPATDEVVLRAEQHRRLMSALTTLSEPHRTPLLLRYFDGLPPREIASKLGLSAATVSVRLHRGLGALRNALDEQHGGRRSRWSGALAVLALPTPLHVAPLVSLPLAGALAMSPKLIAGLAAAAALVGGFWVWHWAGERESHLRAGAAPGEPLVATPRLEGRPATPPREAVQPELPAPVNLAQADRERDLFGDVVDGRGRPIAGALLETLSYPWQRAGLLNMGERDHFVAGPSARSANDGTFSVRLEPGALRDLRVTAAGFAIQQLADRQAGERVHVVLTAGASLVVLVEDESGRPVEGARVRFFRHPRMGVERVEASGRTATDGRCLLSELPEHAFGQIEVQHEKFGPTNWLPAEALSGPPTEVRVVLPTGRTLEGRVLDATSGEPIAGARVGLGWTFFKAVTTGADGAYRLEGYTGKLYVGLYASAPGHVAAAHNEIPASGPIDLRLGREALVVGRLLTAAGAAAASARVAVAAGANDGISSFATSDVEGRFRVLGVERGTPHALLVVAPGSGRLVLDFDFPDQDLLDLGDVALPEPSTLSGRVWTSAGKPAPDVPLELRGTNADRDRLRPGQPALYLGFQGVREQRRTDDQGRFAFPDLAPGDYEVEAQPLGQRWVKTSVQLVEGQRGAEARLELAGGRSLMVTVKDERGRPVPAAEVTARMDDGYEIGRTADGQGVARFVGDRPFTSVEVMLVFTGRSFLAPPVRTLAADEQAIEVTVTSATQVGGVVRGPEGALVPYAVLEVLRDGQPFQQFSPFSGNQVFADGEGRFEILVPAGVELTLRLLPTTSPDGRVLTGELGRVVAGAPPLELRQRVVANDQTMSVIVTGPDGAPAPGIQVYARLMGQDVPGANVLTDAAGRAELKRLPAVPLLVQATPTAGVAGRERWAKWNSGLVTPAGQDLQARLLVGRVLEGRALDPEDQPVAGALVSLMNRSGVVDGVRSDTEGRFRLVVSPEAEGPFSLSASTNTLMATLKDVVPDAKPVVLSMSR